jgi:hypothetical protein
MKKLTYILVLLTIGAFLNSCSDEPEFTKNLNIVSFEFSPVNMVVEKNSTTDRTAKVYTTQVTTTDRTYTIQVLSDLSTADPGSYTIPASVTVPANSNVGEFTITISDVNIPATGVKLVLGLESDETLVTKNNLTINMQRFCPFVIDNFVGDFIITEAGYGDYPTSITLDPDVPNRIWITNFWDWTNDLAYFDFDPNNGTVTMPSQVLTMGDGNDYTCVGSGTYNACAGTFHMEYGGDVAGTVHDFNPAP